MIAQLGEIGDRLNHADDFGGDLLVQLHIAFEVGHDRSRQRFRFNGIGVGVGERDRGCFIIFGAIGIFLYARALEPFDQHLDGAIGQFEQLQDAGERADFVNRVRARIVVGSVLLGRQQDQRVVLHHFFERADRFLAADEQRHDHMREDDDVTERQHRIRVAFAVDNRWPGFRGRHGLIPFVVPPCTQSAAFCATATRCREVPASFGRLRSLLRRIVSGTNLNLIFATDSIRWLSGMGVSSHGKMPAKWG